MTNLDIKPVPVLTTAVQVCLGMCCVSLCLNLSCLLVSTIQFLFTAKLVRSKQGRIR